MSVLSQITLMVIIGYVVGGFPFGYWIGRWHGIDVCKQGSGNIGATNVGRLLGRKWGIAVFLLDAMKAFIPTLITGMYIHRPPGSNLLIGPETIDLARVLVVMSCILGHNFSIFLGLKGGKGVATALGGALGVFPEYTYPAMAALAIWILVALMTRYISLASMAAALAFPLAFFLMSGRTRAYWEFPWPLPSFVLLVPALVILRHRANIGRLLNGTEPRFGR